MEETEFLFSKDLREKLDPLKDLSINEALSSPDFFKALLDHAGMDSKEQEEMWKRVGRPDFYCKD